MSNSHFQIVRFISLKTEMTQSIESSARLLHNDVKQGCHEVLK